MRPEDFPPGFAVPERQGAGAKTCLAFMTARRARDVEAWNGLVRSLSGEEAADAFIIAVGMLEAVGTFIELLGLCPLGEFWPRFGEVLAMAPTRPSRPA